jgi:autotransporter-associated beta strand protein
VWHDFENGPAEILLNMKNFNFVLTAVICTFLNLAEAGASPITWLGGGADDNWSTPGNWSPTVPTSTDDVSFLDNDATGTSTANGLSNNIVDLSFGGTIKSLRYGNTSGFHNTRLSRNLVATGSGSVYALHIGNGVAGGTVYATISGNATLAVTNTSGNITLVQGTNSSGGSGPFKATLNMAGLDNFFASVSTINLAINADGNTSATNNRPSADLFLAKTNTISATTVTISESFNNSGSQSSMRLGQTNALNFDTLRVGSRKGNGLLNFNTGWTSPTARFRNKAGTGRGTWYIGEDLGSASGTGSTGLIDLSAGSVDATVETIYVGKGQTLNASGDGVGTLTFASGTIDANTVEIGYQSVAGQSVGRGTVNVNTTNALLKVNNDIRFGFLLPSPTDTNFSTLNINGGRVSVGGNIVRGAGYDSLSTITLTNNGVLDLKPAGDLSAGNIDVDVLNIGVATLTNFGTLSVSNINVRNPAVNFTLGNGQLLAPMGKGVVGTLLVRSNNFTLDGATIYYDLADSGSAGDKIGVEKGLTLSGTNQIFINTVGAFGGTSLIGGPENLQVAGALANSRYTLSFSTNTVPNIDLVVGGNVPKSLTWSGDGSANLWDLATTANFDAGAEKFFNLDTVTFDDTGSSSPAIKLVGSLTPSAVAVTGAKSYVFSGSGYISGAATLSYNGTGKLTVLTTNDTLGNVDSSGTIEVGDGTTANGSLGSGAINNNGSLVFNPAAGTQVVSGGISGSGSLVKKGPGATKITGVNTFSGDVLIQEGTLIGGTASALGDTSGTTTITNGGTFDISGVRFDTESITISGAGANGVGAIINNGAAQANALATVIMSGDATIGGTGRLDINTPSLAANGYKLTKVGTNMLSLWNNAGEWDPALGDIDIAQGDLRFQNNVKMGDATKIATVRSNATLEFNGSIWPMNKIVSLEGGACLFQSTNTSSFIGTISLLGSNVVDTANTTTLTIDGVISGTGGLTKRVGTHPSSATTSTGAGSLILTASNTFSGDFRIHNGTVSLTGQGSVSGASNIVLATGTLDVSGRSDGSLTLKAGKNLKGAGTITGNVVSPVSTTVSPGETAVGTLTISGNTTLRGTTVMDTSKTGVTKTSDRLTVAGTLDLGGTLTVNYSGAALVAGDKFTLFSAGTIMNNFTTVNLPNIAGLVWTNNTAVDGTIEVLSVVVPEPTNAPALTLTTSPTALGLAWSTNYTSYILQAQTNPPSIGLSTNWVNVSGVVSNQLTVPINSTNSVFYRLLKP